MPSRLRHLLAVLTTSLLLNPAPPRGASSVLSFLEKLLQALPLHALHTAWPARWSTAATAPGVHSTPYTALWYAASRQNAPHMASLVYM